ncbi:Zn(2)-C6 fungal-type DNA-binding domain protein [Cordyceps fumosorosea ARSEF 2679]|uniref:Zn(2)-C6 fungal-type DNA-binding domain protein n=1 Tax=Cordyceps fumosorosea (strain ARSEF 2679) TaxID=1081104 RepID=A0A167LPL3_CORFA|nr:Zn(2)-C6 fungal-type DNA-binding domain protein [Cordyceps fumosorosea ARSEF 2679]OAA53341.1 Zn(2)-C6 fungal-type DNA-binding domain protein [Cordyceps fumosorosea ARSEF 2679]
MRAMPIIRSRTGCFTCRRRKKKCNEEKPLCSGCRRNHLECTWPTENASAMQTRTKNPTSPAVSKSPTNRPRATSFAGKPDHVTSVQHDPTARQRAESHSSSESNHDRGDVDMIVPQDVDAHAPLVADTSPIMPVSPVASHADMFSDSQALTISSMSLAADPSILTLSPLSLLPNHSRESSDLLSYYLHRTANSMGNGSTDINPFIAKLVPLAFDNPLVLQLLLAQSAAHRQSAEAGVLGTEVAHHYYTDSLRMFRNVVGEYVSGKEENTLALTVGSLILCLTEVARGDIHGTIFDHLRASESMLNLLLTRPKSEIPEDLPDFLVEFAIHMTVTSIMSTDRSRPPPELSPTIEGMGHTLISKGYVGQLSGCWLELLLLIPHVYHLGHRIMTTRADGKLSPEPDDIITFGMLQSQIMAFFPDLSVNPYSRLASLVFKQGVLLYLWSILGTPHQERGNEAHMSLMAGAVSDALSLLSQFPATLRINTSLCWPLAVIGCCTTDADVQQVLRERLQIMHRTIGLGNMKETLILLEHIWTKPPEDVSPWKLSEVMQDRQVWISFA